MKKSIWSVLVISASAFLFAACSGDDSNNPTLNVDDTLKSGKWKVTYFWDEKDETYYFNSYTFEFKTGNVLTAVKGSDTYNGIWSTTTDDSKKKLVINFSAPEELAEISDDWKIIEMTDSKIRLDDVSGGDGSVEYLTFEKI
jgi:major membrane immunogen (membrane-anchored lipoprotein)